MGTYGWRTDSPLTAQLRDEFAGFDYYQLVRLLIQEGQANGNRTANAIPVEKRLRFSADLSLAFPGQEVSSVSHREQDGPVRLTTVNYCIGSSVGPLPESYSEWLRRRAANGDRAMADFFDIFNHRFNVLRYHIKAKSRLALSTVHPEKTDMARYLASVMGLRLSDMRSTQRRSQRDGSQAIQPKKQVPIPMASRAMVCLAALLGNNRRSQAAIEQVLAVYLQGKVRILPLKGRWYAIDEEEQMRLGRRHYRLGEDSVLGSRFWDQQSGIELIIADLPYARFRSLLPGGEAHDDFVRILAYLTNRQVHCDVRLQLQAGCRPPNALQTQDSGCDLRLGYTSWVSGPVQLADDAEEQQRMRLGLNSLLTGYAGENDIREASFSIPAWEVAA